MLCISLACYSNDSLPDDEDLGDSTDAVNSLMETPCEWPSDNGLAIEVVTLGKSKALPLAPPVRVSVYLLGSGSAN